MLAGQAEQLPAGGGWVYELKLDGYRIVALVDGGDVRLTSRGGKDYTARFGRVAEALASAFAVECVVDGEVCALDERGHPSFSLLQAGAGTLVYYAFDLLQLRGEGLVDRPLEERRELLESVLRPGPVIRLSHAFDDGRALLEHARGLGLEGVMAKRLGSRYSPGRRSRDWLKLKLRVRDTFTIVGHTRGTGARRMLGALVLAERDGDTLRWVGDVGTGFSEAEIGRLLSQLEPLGTTRPTVRRPTKGEVVWAEPRLRCRVEYAERTAEGRLRAPSYLGLESAVPRQRAERVELSNLDKPFFPELGVTKGDLIAYYRTVAPVLVEHLRDRPFTMLRYPDGVHGKHFFQKDAPSHTPRFVRTTTQRGIRYPLVNDADALLWMVNMGCIDMNAWCARADRPDRPDWVMFDLDPAEQTPFAAVAEVARLLRTALHSFDLEGHPKTSGGKGMHVLVPIVRRYDQEQVRAFAAVVAVALARTAPDLITTEWKRSERRGVLIDVNQNGYGRTTASVYSVRPRPAATVSTPLAWDEVGDQLDIGRFTMAEVVRRVSRRGDLLAPVLSQRHRLPRL